MTMWCIRAGRSGEREEFNLEHGVVVNGWTDMGDMSGMDRDAIRARLRECSPGIGDGRLSNHTGQLDRFVNVMEIGDHVVLPLKKRSAIAVGRITGAYQHRPDFPADAQQTRAVEWLGEFARSSLTKTTLYTLSSSLTIFRVYRRDADAKILAALGGRSVRTGDAMSADDGSDSDDGIATTLDIEQYAIDAIRDHIIERFKGHRLEALVAALLRADGFTTLEVPEGRDGGIDVLAGRGSMGFDSPRIAVQVKSVDQPIGAPELRHLRGVMNDFSADRGLFVSWSGFTGEAERESRKHFFNVRLWDADDLIGEMFRRYHDLPADIQAEIPLKQVWTLVDSIES